MKLRNLLILFLPMLLIILYGSSHIPEGKLITSSVSPNGTYKVNAYRWDGGATTDTAIRGEVESLETGQKRNIYWQYQRQIVKDFFIKFTKNPQKRCQKHRMAPDTSFDRLHFSVQQVFAEIRVVW